MPTGVYVRSKAQCKALSLANKGKKRTKAQRKRISEARKKLLKKRPDLCKAASKRLKNLWNQNWFRQVRRKAVRKQLKAFWNNPNYVKAQSLRMTKRNLEEIWTKPGHRESMAKASRIRQQKQLADPKFRAKAVASIAHARSFTPKRTSKPQLHLFERLLQAGFKGFCLEYPLKGFLLDIANPKKKLDIEVDGEYWHSRPEVIKRDRKRDKILKNLGWKVIRVGTNQGAASRLVQCLAFLY